MREYCAEDGNGKSQRFRASLLCTGTPLARPHSSSLVHFPSWALPVPPLGPSRGYSGVRATTACSGIGLL